MFVAETWRYPVKSMREGLLQHAPSTAARCGWIPPPSKLSTSELSEDYG